MADPTVPNGKPPTDNKQAQRDIFIEADGGFWGNARDLAIIGAALISFAGVIYTYTYLHVLGIEFSAADADPTGALLAASKIFVSQWWILILIAFGAVAVYALGRHLLETSKNITERRACSLLRLIQITLTLACALAICYLGDRTARQAVHDLRTRATNPVDIDFVTNAEAKYPALVKDANKNKSLRIVRDTADKIYVLVQPTPVPSAPNELPQAYVYSVLKDDIVSIGTRVPNEAK